MSNDLQKQNDLADALLQKLERIHQLWQGLPTEEELNELLVTAMNLSPNLEHAREIFNSDEFPELADLKELTQAANSLAASLDRAHQRFNDDDFPTLNELQELAQQAARLQSNLNLREAK
jgi:hypothetical protein